MVYTPQTWTDDVSVVNAERLGNIETGIKDAHDDLAAKVDGLGGVKAVKYADTLPEWTAADEGTLIFVSTGLVVDGGTTPPPDPPDPAVLAAPTGLAVSNVTSTSLTLTWTPSVTSGITEQRVYQNSARIVTVASGVTSYAVTGLTPGTGYTFNVTAFDGTANSGYSNAVAATTTAAATSAARFPGDPNPRVTGKTLWGAAVGTNGSASVHEGSGEILALRRRYWSNLSDWNTGGPMANACRDDHAAGRLPWVSCKISDWVAAGNGAHDAQFDAFINEVSTMSRPVWFSLNHEPENDGGDLGAGWEATAGAGYRAMQRRFRLRMNALGSTNLAFGSSLMYYTFNPISGRDPDAWYPADVDGVPAWDFMGNDHYTEPEQEPDRTNAWQTFVDYSHAKGLPVTMPEWGIRGEDPEGPRKMLKLYDRRVVDDNVGFAYFDSGANSTGTGWVLDNENGLLNEFHRIQGLATSTTLAEMGY